MKNNEKRFDSRLAIALQEGSDITVDMIVEDYWLTLEKLGEINSTKRTEVVFAEIRAQYRLLLTRYPHIYGMINSQALVELITNVVIPGTTDKGFNVISEGQMSIIKVNARRMDAREDPIWHKVIDTAISNIFNPDYIVAETLTEITTMIATSTKITIDSTCSLLQKLPARSLEKKVREYLMNRGYFKVFGGYMRSEGSIKPRKDEVEQVIRMYYTLCQGLDLANQFEIFKNVLLGDTADFEDFIKPNKYEHINFRYDYSWIPKGTGLTVIVKRIFDITLKSYSGIIKLSEMQKIINQFANVFTMNSNRTVEADLSELKQFDESILKLTTVLTEVRDSYADERRVMVNEIAGVQYSFYTDHIDFDIALAEEAVPEMINQAIHDTIEYLIRRAMVVPSIFKIKEYSKAFTSWPIESYFITEYLKDNNLKLDYNGFVLDGKTLLDPKEIYASLQYHEN